jgi:hypothetical protein
LRFTASLAIWTVFNSTGAILPEGLSNRLENSCEGRRLNKAAVKKINLKLMQYMICFRENEEAVISSILGRVDANSVGEAIANATVAFADDPLVQHPNGKLEALMVQTLHLVEQEVYFSIKKTPTAGRNQGAVSRDALWIYVNAIAGKDLNQRMQDLSHVLPDIVIYPNENVGRVMGSGSGNNYAIFARFYNTDAAVNYIQLLGYNVSGNAGFGN